MARHSESFETHRRALDSDFHGCYLPEPYLQIEPSLKLATVLKEEFIMIKLPPSIIYEHPLSR